MNNGEVGRDDNQEFGGNYPLSTLEYCRAQADLKNTYFNIGRTAAPLEEKELVLDAVNEAWVRVKNKFKFTEN